MPCCLRPHKRLGLPLRGAARPGVLARAGWLRAMVCLVGVALLAGCASSGPQMSASQEAAQYQARARRNYTAPGPAWDPWGPYIVEAAQRFDVPERWVREVIRAESSGKVLETSAPGAMGLMQVMPATYDELRARYDLGDDPYNPRDNVLAGTAYLRQMYDLYGFPGFLAAYNAGPGRLDAYLTRRQSLPDETRNYVRKIAPRIAGVSPNRPPASGDLAMNQLPMNIPPGPRYPSRRQQPVMLAENRGRPAPVRDVQQMALVAPPTPVPPPPTQQGGQTNGWIQGAPMQQRTQVAAATPSAPASRTGFHLISPAMADTLPAGRAALLGGAWAVQVGAFGSESLARSAAESARGQASMLAHAHPAVQAVQVGKNKLYRARLTGLSRDNANAACDRLGRARGCMVLSPDQQS